MKVTRQMRDSDGGWSEGSGGGIELRTHKRRNRESLAANTAGNDSTHNALLLLLLLL